MKAVSERQSRSTIINVYSTVIIVALFTIQLITSFENINAFPFTIIGNNWWNWQNFFGTHNDANQAIGQNQLSYQNAQCLSGHITALSCNNVGIQGQANLGNTALAQR